MKIPSNGSARFRLDTNQLVYDEEGNALHYYQYTKLLNTGEYTIRQSAPSGTPGVKAYLKKLDPQENLRFYEMIKPRIALKSPLLQEGKVLDISPFLGTINQEDFNRKAVVIVFWYADCPPCTESFNSLNDIFGQINNPENLIVVAVTYDNEQIASAKLKQKPLMYARLLSNAGQIISAYQLTTYPSFVVADKDHIIRFAVSGLSPITIPLFKSTIRQVLIQ
ncbi:MAG TPA: TlpA disulfide reductase family protein [Mucilaginibacter sp.]